MTGMRFPVGIFSYPAIGQLRMVLESSLQIRTQFLRYAIIGVVLNSLLYFIYIMLTRSLLSSYTAMTIIYCSGVLLGFLLNRKITFSHQGNKVGALLRYIASYFLGYIYNYIALLLLVGRAGYPHEAVQAGVIVTLWVLLFVLQRYWVFAVRPSRQGQSPLRGSTP
jgi:putative flippase GtrA